MINIYIVRGLQTNETDRLVGWLLSGATVGFQCCLWRENDYYDYVLTIYARHGAKLEVCFISIEEPQSSPFEFRGSRFCGVARIPSISKSDWTDTKCIEEICIEWYNEDNKTGFSWFSSTFHGAIAISGGKWCQCLYFVSVLNCFHGWFVNFIQPGL